MLWFKSASKPVFVCSTHVVGKRVNRHEGNFTVSDWLNLHVNITHNIHLCEFNLSFFDARLISV
jgi:hypothetical protein